MKKIICSLLIILSFHLCLFAQNTDTSKVKKIPGVLFEDKTVKNEMGFDMFSFLSFLKIIYQGEPSNVFSIGYNRELTDRTVLRVTVGSGYINNVIKSASDSATAPSLRTVDILENLYVGIAWEKEIYRRCQFYYGVDLQCQYGNNKEQELTAYKNNVQLYTNDNFLIGPGPFLGLIFYITPRLSINFETNLNFVYNSSITKITDAQYPQLNSNTSTKGFSTSFTIPHTLFLNMKF